MFCSSDIAEKPFILTLTLKFDLDGSFVKIVPSPKNIDNKEGSSYSPFVFAIHSTEHTVQNTFSAGAFWDASLVRIFFALCPC